MKLGSCGGTIRVAVLDDYQCVARDYGDWKSLGPRVHLETFSDHTIDESEVAARLEPFDIVVAMRERTPFPRSLLERLTTLKLLVTTGMVNRSIDIAAARELGIVVSGTRSLLHPTVELTWGLILALARKICAEDDAIRAGGWQTSIGMDLAGRTLGVVGVGRIGRRIAAIGRAFEMNVIGWSPNLTVERASTFGVEAVEKADLFKRADVVTIHLVLNEHTRGIIGVSELSIMKRTAYIVNTARAALVDQEALTEALRRGAIAGAALDVFETEPLAPDDPMRSLDRTVLTPHIGFVSTGTYELFFRDIIENIGGYLRGAPIRIVDV